MGYAPGSSSIWKRFMVLVDLVRIMLQGHNYSEDYAQYHIYLEQSVMIKKKRAYNACIWPFIQTETIVCTYIKSDWSKKNWVTWINSLANLPTYNIPHGDEIISPLQHEWFWKGKDDATRSGDFSFKQITKQDGR